MNLNSALEFFTNNFTYDLGKISLGLSFICKLQNWLKDISTPVNLCDFPEVSGEPVSRWHLKTKL